MTGACTVEMPRDSHVLSVGVQGRYIMVWASVPVDAPVDVKRQFFLAGTGLNELPKDLGRFVGTVQVDWFVGHLFELPA